MRRRKQIANRAAGGLALESPQRHQRDRASEVAPRLQKFPGAMLCECKQLRSVDWQGERVRPGPTSNENKMSDR